MDTWFRSLRSTVASCGSCDLQRPRSSKALLSDSLLFTLKQRTNILQKSKNKRYISFYIVLCIVIIMYMFYVLCLFFVLNDSCCGTTG